MGGGFVGVVARAAESTPPTPTSGKADGGATVFGRGGLGGTHVTSLRVTACNPLEREGKGESGEGREKVY